MAGSDAVVAWVGDDGEPVITDVHLQNQSPAGIKSANRQVYRKAPACA